MLLTSLLNLVHQIPWEVISIGTPSISSSPTHAFRLPNKTKFFVCPETIQKLAQLISEVIHLLLTTWTLRTKITHLSHLRVILMHILKLFFRFNENFLSVLIESIDPNLKTFFCDSGKINLDKNNWYLVLIFELKLYFNFIEIAGWQSIFLKLFNLIRCLPITCYWCTINTIQYVFICITF